ncbi:MAG: glycosyltransferase [Pyrinomonadaceae bacterium]
MKILHVIPSMGPAYGGPSKGLQELSTALSAVGVSIDVATTNADGPDSLRVPLGVAVEEKGVNTYYFPRQGRGSFVFSWPLTQWLWRHQSGYDLVHVHTIFAYPTLAASRIAQRRRVPYVVTPHGMVEPWCLNYKSWKKQPYMKLIEQQTLSMATALHALVSQEEVNLRALDLVNPTFVLPNGVNLSEFSALPPKQLFAANFPQAHGRKIILFLGRIDPKKGLDHLVNSFAEILQEAPHEKPLLVIAGPDLVGYGDEVKSLIEEKGLTQNVLFTGMLTGEIKLAAFSAADVFVLPSRSEGFSMAVLEALAAGCPVVITEACNFPELAADGAGRVIKTDAGELTRVLLELLQSDDLRREMGEQGKQLMRREYSWPIIAARLGHVYQDILEGTRKAQAWRAQ